jgi:hypothetical protein
VALQLVNLSPNAIELDMYSAVCQLIIFRLCTPATQGYTDKPDSKYKGEEEILASKIYDDEEPEKKKEHTVIRWMKKYIEPILPSVLVITLLLANVYNSVKDIPIKNILNQAAEIPIGFLIGLGFLILYIFLKSKGDKNY